MVLTAEEKRQRGAEAVRRHRARETNEERQERLRRDRVRHRGYREHSHLSVSTRALSVAQVLPTCMDNVAAATAASIGPRRSRAWIEEDYQRLHPVSEATKLKAIKCLREALGAVGLDEVVCAVCDACTLQSRCVRVNLSDHKYVTKMKRLLCCEGEELPPALVAQYDCSGMHPELHGVLLSARGVDPEGDVIMCKECHASISKSQIPKFSIKNGFYVGRLPAELEDTTLPERLMTQLVSIVAVTRVVRGGIHRAIRSHCLMFDATPGPAATLLPSQLGDAATFRVVLAGPFTSLQQARVRKMHQVRRRTLERLLDFYRSYNALYDNVTFDCSTVPSDSFPNHIFQEVQEAEAEADDVDRELDHLGGATETDMTSREDDVIERRVVFVADDREPSQEPVGSNDSTAAKRILVRHSSHFATRDNNLFAKMFPHLFPFGRGHPGEKRHCPVSFDLCIRHYCLLSSRRFVEDELFMLASFDHISLQRMYTQIALRCKRKPEQFAPYSDISEVELLDALERKQRRRQGRSAASREEATGATHLLETVELSGAALWGSDSERAQCRRQAFAYQIRYGQPALFITLTPNVSESFVMAQYSGVTSVDTLFDAELSRKPSKSELQGASMKNDAASARLFVRYVNAFIDHVLGVSSTGAIAKSTGDGLLGRVKAYFGMVETQGGGTLHAHFLVWLCAAPPNLDAYKRMMARFGDQYRRDIEAYTDSVVTTAPALNIASSSCVRCGHSYADLKPLPIPDDAFDDPDRQRHGSAAEPLLVQCPQCALKVSSQHVLRRLLLDHRPASWPPPLRNLSEDEMDAAIAREVPRRGSMANARQALFRRDLFLTSKSDGDEQPDPEGDYLRMLNRVPQRTERRQDDVFRADSVSRSIAMMPPSCDDARWPALTFEFVVSVLMYLFNLHWWCHVGSCFKKRRSGAPGTCRYRFPQARVAETIAADDGLTIARRTACEYVNGYNPVMMATFKSNHDVQVLIGGADALLRIYYATKYVTKSQELVESVTAVALAAFRKRQARELLDQSEPQDRATVGRRRAGSLGFAISNRREVAGPLAALYLLGGSCCFKSTKTAPLPLVDIVRQLTRNASYECDLVNVSQSNDNTVYRSTTLLDDYRFRPRRLDDLCLYEFVAWHFRRKQTAAASAESAFLPDHPLVSTHCLGTHTQEVIPLIAGARVPYVDSNSPPDIVQERTKYALTLFKPFRAVTDLVADTANDAAWNNAYRDWFPTCSAFVQEILHNMDDSHNAKKKAKEAVANAHSDYDDPDPAAADDITGTRNDVDVAAGLGIDTFADGEEWSSGADDIFGTDDQFPVFPTAVSDAESAQAFRELLASSAEATAASFATLQQSPAVESRLPDFTEDEYKHWLEDASTDEAVPSAGFRQENPTQVIELLSKTLESDSSQRPPSAEHVQQPSTIEYYASIAEVSSAFTLNDRQHIAFTLIATALLRRFLLQEQSELDPSSDYRGQNYAAALENQQLLMFLGGAGGTGKSRVIDAVDALCRSWHRESSLVKTALTGKAATLIGARTLASFLLRIKHAAKDKQFAPLDALVIDEVSMMSKRELLKLDQSLRKYKQVPDVPFGGVHIILVGDFLQMPPVGADAIFINPDSKRNASVIDSDGFDLWRRFTTVVVLNESVRFRRDPEWGEGCRLARVGVWTENFVNIINSRVFQAADVARLALESSVLVTPENVTRLAINNAFIAQTASQMPDGTYPIRVLADFKGALNELSQSDVAYVLGLPDNRFGRLAPYLDLIAGMPVQITQNVGTAKGVANGTLGTLESVHFLPGTAFKLVMDGASGMLVQIPSQPPDYALLRLPRPRAVPLRPGLDPELFPVFFNTTVFSKMRISLPPAPGGHRRYVELKIHQFPFVPAIGSTVYKIQGETLDSMVVVDWKSALAMVNKPQQTYLLVSRVTSRHAFIALSPLTTKLQRWSKPPPGALEEEDRLNDLNNRTIAGFHQQRVLTTAGSSGGGRSSNPLQH